MNNQLKSIIDSVEGLSDYHRNVIFKFDTSNINSDYHLYDLICGEINHDIHNFYYTTSKDYRGDFIRKKDYDVHIEYSYSANRILESHYWSHQFKEKFQLFLTQLLMMKL